MIFKSSVIGKSSKVTQTWLQVLCVAPPWSFWGTFAKIGIFVKQLKTVKLWLFCYLIFKFFWLFYILIIFSRLGRNALSSKILEKQGHASGSTTGVFSWKGGKVRGKRTSKSPQMIVNMKHWMQVLSQFYKARTNQSKYAIKENETL